MSKPSCRECIDEVRLPSAYARECVPGYVGYAVELAARVERVLALHKERSGWCIECSRVAGEYEAWPCPTVRLLDGDEL